MKKLLTFLTLLTLFFTTGWAADVSVTTSISDYATANNWSDQTRYASVTMDANITATASSGTNTGKYYSTDNTWRFYANENAKLTINAASGCSLKSVTLNFTVKDNGTISYSGSGLTSGTAVSVSGTAADFTISQSSGSKGKVFITSISVTYSDGGSSTPTTYSLTLPTGLTGGTVTSNYTGDLTQIASGTSITVTATPATGYTLDYMRANGVDVSNPYEFVINAATTITAAFKEESTTPSGDYMFYESFDKSNGLGGNDGSWSGNLTTTALSTDIPRYLHSNFQSWCLEWQFRKYHINNRCNFRKPGCKYHLL